MKIAISLVAIAGLVVMSGCTSLKRKTTADFGEIIERLAEQQNKTIGPPTELTLVDAKLFALENNPDVTAAALRVDQALARLSQARSTYFPNLGLYTDYDHTEWRPTYGSPFSQNQRTQIHTSGVSASWTLFDGLRREFMELSAIYGKEAAEEVERDVRRLLCKAVAQGFLNAMLQQEMVRIAEADLVFNESLLKAARDKKESGAGSQPEILTFTIQRNQAEISLIDARSSLKVAVIVLAELLGIGKADFATIPKFLPPNMGELVDGIDLDEELAKAILRPDMQVLVRQMAASEANVEAARGALYPTLVAQGNAGYSRDDDMNYEDPDKLASWGVTAQWDLDIGGAKRAALAEAKVAFAEAKAVLASKYNSVCGEIRQQAVHIQSYGKTLKILEKNSVMAKDLRDMEKERYNLNDVSITRLNEVRSNLTRTRAQEAITRIQLFMALENLRAGTNTNLPPKPKKE